MGDVYQGRRRRQLLIALTRILRSNHGIASESTNTNVISISRSGLRPTIGYLLFENRSSVRRPPCLRRRRRTHPHTMSALQTFSRLQAGGLYLLLPTFDAMIWDVRNCASPTRYLPRRPEEHGSPHHPDTTRVPLLLHGAQHIRLRDLSRALRLPRTCTHSRGEIRLSNQRCRGGGGPRRTSQRSNNTLARNATRPLTGSTASHQSPSE